MSDKITPELVDKVLRLINEGNSPSAIKLVIQEETGYKKTKSNEIYNDIIKGVSFDSDIFDFDLEQEEAANKPYFNKTSGKYVVYIAALGRNIVVSEERHKRIVELYSDWDGEGQTLNEVCRAIQWPRPVLTQYLKAFGITKDSLPITENELEQYDDEELTSRLHELRKFSLYQKFEKEDWTATRADAQKWRALSHRQLKPFEEAVKNFKLPEITNLTPKEFNSGDPKTLVIGLSDIHWGSAANPIYLYNPKGGWDTQKTIKVVENYAESILESVVERNYSFDKVVILMLGDFLHSCSGKTGRGTELKFDCIREEQFDYALTSLIKFVGTVAPHFNKCEVHTVGGNHHYEAELGLYRAVDMAFRNIDFIKFNHYSSRPAPFLVDSTLFLLDHGADSVERTYVPTKEAQLRTHVNSLLVKRPDLTAKAKTILFCQGDKHHHKHIEFDNFEFIMFGTSVGADQHADTNNWNNRARQSCLVLDETGLKEILHFYTDELLK